MNQFYDYKYELNDMPLCIPSFVLACCKRGITITDENHVPYVLKELIAHFGVANWQKSAATGF